MALKMTCMSYIVVIDRYCTGSNSCVFYSTAKEPIVLFHLIPRALQSRDKAPAGTLALCQTQCFVS